MTSNLIYTLGSAAHSLCAQKNHKQTKCFANHGTIACDAFKNNHFKCKCCRIELNLIYH